MLLYHSSNSSDIKAFNLKVYGDEENWGLHGTGIYFYDNKEAAKEWSGKYLYTVELPDEFLNGLAIMKKWNKENIIKYIDYRNKSDKKLEYDGALFPADSHEFFTHIFFDSIIMHYSDCDSDEMDEITTLIDSYLKGIFSKEVIDLLDCYYSCESDSCESDSCKYTYYNQCKDTVNECNIHEVVINNQNLLDKLKIIKLEEKLKSS